MNSVQGFVERGLLGSEDTYVQRVYSGDDVSYSTLMFPSTTPFNRKSVIQQTAKSMISTVSAADKFSSPQVQILNKSLLPKIDDRLVFLSYVTHGSKGSINVEASASIKTDSCWSILRFSALNKQAKEEALNQFATLIRATSLIE